MSAKIIKILEAENYAQRLDEAAQMLQQGGLVVMPTETVYGLAAILTNPPAISKLRALRGSDDPPFTIHLGDPSDAMAYLGEISDLGHRMMRKLWPGPVGLIFDVAEETRRQISQKLHINESDIYQNGAITLRCPDHLVTEDLLRQVTEPVVAITIDGRAGLSNGWVDWQDKADLILDAGPTRFSKPSTLVKVQNDRFQIVRTGVYDERIIDKLMKTTILFICSGNTCRSAMAEGLARKILAEQLDVPEDQLVEQGYVVMSAGAFALAGTRAAPPAVSALRQMGVDLSRHRSRLLSVELINQSDAIFAMSENHRRSVLALAPSAANKVHLLDPGGDIDDPIGGNEALYLSLAEQLNNLIADRLTELKLC